MTVSPDDYKNTLRRFAQRVPELLVRHGSTAHLAVEVNRLDLVAQLDRRQFTLAVIGRMKSGKSTLINALLGRRLAPVGVDEMTATVNWFDDGDDEKGKAFEIHWKDIKREPERRPLAAIADLSGHNKEAELISYIRFSANSPFLKGVRLIDTPGTMSTIDSHEAATMDLLTRQYGERADATVLVLPTMISKDQKTLLEEFASHSRFPGQGPYNTIAVLQKWETTNVPEPEVYAWEFARDFMKRLSGHVSEVIPVSGLMASMARDVPPSVLDRLAFLATNSDDNDIRAIVVDERRFLLDRSGVSLSAEERSEMFEQIKQALLGHDVGTAAGTWEMVKFAIDFARRRHLRNADDLRKALLGASNIERFQDVLHSRFFALSGLIQTGAVLKKALDPCRTALFGLRGELDHRRELVALGASVKAMLEAQPTKAEPDQRVMAYLQASLPLINEQVKPIDATLRELDYLVDLADRDFRLLMADIEHLRALGERPGPLSAEQVMQARRLFGQFGMERHIRLGLPETASVAQQLFEAKALHAVFSELRWASRTAGHAEERLARMLEELEALVAR
jgi:GTPase SAR1 family protein